MTTKESNSNSSVSVFHDFHPSPYGGGNQFMTALTAEFERRGLRVEKNKVSDNTAACLFNSFNFDFNKLLKIGNNYPIRMIHRVDGPVDKYRGDTRGVDKEIWELNKNIADTTIFQSKYSLNAHKSLGMEFANPCVISNAVDPSIFYSSGTTVNCGQSRKIKLISSSWSDNLNKGAHVYKWLEDNLDWDKYEYTFVGRSPIKFNKITMIAPMNSVSLSDLLREHDIYITASMHDPCSNALIEALACGLPAIVANSGGHPELIGRAGYTYDDKFEIPDLIEELVSQYVIRQKNIEIQSLFEVGNHYMNVLGF